MEELLEAAYAKTQTTAVARELISLHKMNLRVCKATEADIFEKRLARVEELCKRHRLKLAALGTEHEDTLKEWHEQLKDAREGGDFPRHSEQSLFLKKPSIPLPQNATVVEAGSYIPTVAKQVRETNWGVQWPVSRLVLAASNQSTYVARIRVKPSLRRAHKPNEHAFGLWLWKSGFPADNVQGRNVTYAELTSDDWQYIYLFKVYFYSPAVEGYFYNTVGPLDEGEAFFYDLVEFIPLEQFPDKKLADSLPTVTM